MEIICSIRYIALAVLLIASVPLSFADSSSPKLLLKSGQMSRLSWQAKDGTEVEITSSDHDKTFSARLRGKYEQADWNLIAQSRILVRSEGKQSEFTITIPLSGQHNEIQLLAVGPHGEVEKETLDVFISDWPGFLNAHHAEKKLPLTVGLGFSSISLTQTGQPNFSEDALTLKAEYRILLFPPHWDLSLGTFFTAVPLSTNQSGLNARFLGINLRLGYKLPFIQEPWEVFLFGGVYYTTMFVTQSAFGYQNEYGPQLFPTVRRFFKNGDGVSVYFKYSPVTSGSSAFTSSNREIAVGGAWLWRLRNQHLVSLAFDYSTVHLNFPAQSTNVQVNAVNFGIGYNL